MKKILCPLDFSDVSLNALEFAVALAEKEHGEITLLNIFTPSDFDSILEAEHIKEEYDKLTELAESKLKAISAEIRKISRKKGLASCDYQLHSGKIVDIIKDLTKKEKYELIVTGTTGHSAYDKRYLGGKAQDIIRYAHCSVICVPENYGFHGINKIVYATDYREEDKPAVLMLTELSKTLRSSFEILHVSHHNDVIDKAIFEDFKRELLHFIRTDNVSFNRVIYKHIANGLDAHMKESKADLLVLLQKKTSFTDSVFHTGLTDHLDKFADFPLMILKL